MTKIHMETYAEKFYSWLITFGPRVLLGIIVLLAGLWIINLLSRVINSAMIKKDFDATLKSFLISMIVIALRVFLILAIMQFIGMQMTLFAAIIGAFGVAAGLALSGTLQNFTSGILLLMLKPFKVGDNIITQGLEGTVSSIQIFYTTVITFDNKIVIVPNVKLTSDAVINISREGKRRMDLELKFSYGVDIDLVKNIVHSASQSFEKIMKNHEIRIGVSSIEVDGFKVMVNMWVLPHSYEDTRLAFLEKVVVSLKKSGIKLSGM